MIVQRKLKCLMPISVVDHSEIITRQKQEDLSFAIWKAVAPAYKEEAEGVLRELLIGHARAVMYSILRRSDPVLVDEAVNKVMLNLPEFRGESLFTTWAHRILMRVMYDARRQERRRKETSMNIPGFDLVGEDSPASLDLLLTVKKLLTSEQYPIFEQIVIWGRSQDEAATELDVPQQTLSRQWTEIKGTLKHAFAK